MLIGALALAPAALAQAPGPAAQAVLWQTTRTVPAVDGGVRTTVSLELVLSRGPGESVREALDLRREVGAAAVPEPVPPAADPLAPPPAPVSGPLPVLERRALGEAVLGGRAVRGRAMTVRRPAVPEFGEPPLVTEIERWVDAGGATVREVQVYRRDDGSLVERVERAALAVDGAEALSALWFEAP